LSRRWISAPCSNNCKTMKKVLVITYYWPPGGGSGVQRWLKFVKYLRSFNWEPVVYVPRNPDYPVIDESLLTDIPEGLEVLRKDIWEPYDFYRVLTGKSRDQKITISFTSEVETNRLRENLANVIRSNFFIPDARRFWIRPSTNFLKKYLEDHDVDLVVTTGPPHSTHLIGSRLKNALGVTWIADFRDPWTNIEYFQQLKLSRIALRVHRRLEKKVLTTADEIIVVGNDMRKEFMEIGARDPHVITNGYDHEDFETMDQVETDPEFSIAYIGILMKNQNPVTFWKALRELLNTNEDLKKDLVVKLVGIVDVDVMDTIRKFGLEQHIRKSAYMPHKQVIRFQRESQVLLLLINQSGNARGILTGKFFEYLASGRPVLMVGPEDGDAAQILKETNAGLVSEFENVEKLKQNILTFYERYRKKTLKADTTNIHTYSRKELTRRLASVFDRVTNVSP